MQKTCNNVATNYVLHGNNVVHLTHGSNTLHFFYDAQNSPAVVEYNGVSYGYVKNLQGDIIAIVNASGTKVVEYVYDAWGKLLSKTGSMASTLGTLNPFRYRGYVYDEETGLYYLRSRYYNPVWGRFINLDSNIVGNLFSYCNNNPVILEDSNGQFACYASCMLLADGGGGNYNPYPYYGVSKEIAEAIDIIMSNQQKYGYSKKGDDGKYIYGVRYYKDMTTICCAYLMVGLMGGPKGVPGRRRNAENLQKLVSLDQLRPGMEIFQGTKHCGLVIMYDFGEGPELAVFQSTAVSNLQKNSSIEAAVFMNDGNAGPNITALRSIGSWTDFGYPKVNMNKAFFFNPKDRAYLFGN